MKRNAARLIITTLLVFTGLLVFIKAGPSQDSGAWSPVIPRTWDEEALSSFELPLPNPAASPKYISSDYYNQMPVRPVYKSYSVYYPDIPDLIGVKDRHYFDATGHARHRTIADLMRYAALNQGADMLSSYGGFRPRGELPDPATESR